MIRQIGRYVVLEHGRRDWLGATHKAFDTVCDHLVSLRLIDTPADYAPQSLSMQSLGGWARQLQGGHAHLVGIHDIGIVPVDRTAASRIFVAGGWVKGDSLESIFRERGAVTVEQAYAWMAQILMGLSCAHALGIVHGDLNPGNVWVDGADNIRLLEAGLYSRERFPWIDPRASNRAASYVAPEQLAGATPSASGDLYAAGAIGYRLYMGREPHDIGARGVAREHLDALLDWAMASTVAQRVRTAADFLQELNASSRVGAGKRATRVHARALTWPMQPEQLRRLTARLSNDVGPMAPILIERAAALAESREDFFRRLLEIVPERDRAQRLLRQFTFDQESAYEATH
jgi:serine/threonine protein kinase